ncbi:TetR/AcrR family transcriptional regulator [Eubacteriales bacterium OttesenSCG-928-N14]|nr:TetR/AcrR family transcriptional regulator [Eubacteriales bacterium OttesenSCG-928-N14]
MNTVQNQRVMLTKRLLQESLIQLLQQQSIHKISIRELCEAAGINRSTFYKYYGSQYDLLSEMEEEMLIQIQAYVAQIDMEEDESIVLHIVPIITYLEENIDLARLLLNNNIDPEFPQKLFSLPQIQYLVRTFIGDRYDEEEFDYMFAFIIDGVYGMVRQWLNRSDHISAEKLAPLIIKIFNPLRV